MNEEINPNLPIRGKGVLAAPLKVTKIPEEKYSSPVDLFDFCFGNFFFENVHKSTLSYISDHPNLAHPTYKLTLQHIRAYFGYSMIMNDWKPPKMDHQPFLSQISDSPSDLKVLMGKDWKCPIQVPSKILKFPYKLYDYISQTLDLGPNYKVPKLDSKGNPKLKPNGDRVLVWDLRRKLELFERDSNLLCRQFKKPKDDILCFDETLRPSFSVKDQIKIFMPAKSPPYGQKSFSLVDKDLYCYSFTTALPAQFSYWNGDLESLFFYCFPDEYLNRGLNVTADNYFYTISLVERLAKKHTSITATMRQSRMGKAFSDKDYFKSIIEKQSKTEFQRKVDVFQSTFHVDYENKFGNTQSWDYPIQFCVYHDKISKNPVLFLCSDPGMMLEGSKSELLSGKNKPPISKLYDSTMFYTDKMDQSLRNYTSSRRNGAGRWTTRWITGRLDVFLNNSYVLFKNYVTENLSEETELKKMLNRGSLHTYFQSMVALGLISDRSNTPDPIPDPLSAENNVSEPNQFLCCADLTMKKRKSCQFGNSHNSSNGYSFVRTVCVACHQPTCPDHLTYVCKNCTVTP